MSSLLVAFDIILMLLSKSFWFCNQSCYYWHIFAYQSWWGRFTMKKHLLKLLLHALFKKLSFLLVSGFVHCFWCWSASPGPFWIHVPCLAVLLALQHQLLSFRWLCVVISLPVIPPAPSESQWKQHFGINACWWFSKGSMSQSAPYLGFIRKFSEDLEEERPLNYPATLWKAGG